MKRVLLILFFCSARLFCQDYTVEEIKMKDVGQPYTTYNNILVDKEGFLWYSVQGKLVQDFGNHQNIHKIRYIKEKGDELFLKDILQTGNGNIYGATRKGIYVFNYLTNDSYKLREGSSEAKLIREFDLKGNGNSFLWVLTKSNRIIQYKNGKEIGSYNIVPNEFKSGDFIDGRIYLLGSHIVLVAKSSVYVLDANKKEFYLVSNDPNFREKTFQIAVPNGKFFRKNTSGSYSIKNEKHPYTYIPELNTQMIAIPGESGVNVNDKNIAFNGARIDFITSRENTLSFYAIVKSSKKYLLKEVFSIDFEREINQFLVDENGVIWIAAQGKIYKINAKNYGFFNFFQREKNLATSTRGIVHDKFESTYVISGNEILKITDDGREEVEFVRRSNKDEAHGLRNLAIEKDSLLWFSGFGKELYQYNLYTKKLEEYKIPFKPYSEQLIVYLTSHEYSKNELLLGGNFGLVLFNKLNKTFKRYYPAFDLKKSYVKDVVIKDRKVWVATRKNGLFFFDEITGEQKHYHTKSSKYKIGNDMLYDIHLSDSNDLWMGSVDGLDILDISRNKVFHFDTESGLPDNRVVSIMETPTDFWMGTFNGLSRFNKKNHVISNYYVSDGLPSNEFNQKSFLRHNDSLIFLGGVNGITRFNPNKTDIKQKNKQIRLTRTLYFNKEIDSLKYNQYNLRSIDTISVPYDKSFISLSFANLACDEEKILYKFSNLHSHWVSANDKGEVNLIGLPEGTNTLMVRSGSNEMINDRNTLSYTIYVEEIFYKQEWFRYVSFGSLLLIFGFIYMDRKVKKRKERTRDLQIRQLNDRTFRSQMNPHFIFNTVNNIQSVLLLRGEEVVNEYISSFSMLMRSTIEMSQETEISLYKEIQYLKAYLNLQALRDDFEIQTNFIVDKNLNIKEIKIPPMLFQPVIENALKHGFKDKQNKKKLEVNFIKLSEKLLVEIKDNGIGVDASEKRKTCAEKSYGNKILMERIKIFNEIYSGEIRLKAENLYKDYGTKVTFLIPLVKEMKKRSYFLHIKNSTRFLF